MSIYTKEELLRTITQGDKPELLLFWGHKKSEGQITKSCFSQWYESGFHVDNIYYPTAEHYMMAEKARLFGDRNAETRVIASATPKEAKSIGREVQPFDTKLWAKSGFDIVVRGNFEKFTQNPELSAFLLSTSPAIIVEASPDDAIWGIGLAADHPDASQPLRWPGTNLLGFALTKVRERILKQA